MDDRQLLVRLAAGRLSGDALARDLGLTRAAVWKRIQGLRAAGLAIEGRAGDGYHLCQPLDLLDADAIRAALPATTAAAIGGLDVLWSTSSTNTELLRRSTPETGVEVVLAERQTGGRGRRGRSWASPATAHIYLSLLRGFAGGLSRLGGLSLVAGVAVAEALHACGHTGVRLKWPNDLVVDGRKLAGLLVEGGGEFAGPARAVIGIGVNVRMPPAAAADIGQPWVDLHGMAGTEVPRTPVVALLLAHLIPALDAFDAHGLAPFLPRYAALDALAGRDVRVEDGGRIIEGRALGLADDGALRVEVDGQVRQFHAGEVSVRAS